MHVYLIRYLGLTEHTPKLSRWQISCSQLWQLSCPQANQKQHPCQVCSNQSNAKLGLQIFQDPCLLETLELLVRLHIFQCTTPQTRRRTAENMRNRLITKIYKQIKLKAHALYVCVCVCVCTNT